MKKIIGYLILILLFSGIFIYTAVMTTWSIAIISWLIALALLALTILAVYLIDKD